MSVEAELITHPVYHFWHILCSL